jgi:hypothetical protein
MSQKAAVGLIATGQGPRQEYIDFHGRFLKALGVEVDIHMRNALDGLSLEEIRGVPISPETEVIHSYVHAPGETSERFGPGWGEAIMARTQYVGLIQACIDELEAEGVDAIIWCCAEPFQDGTFQCSKPLVMPYLVGLHYAEVVARSIGNRARIGVFTHGTRQRKQQMEMWYNQPWAKQAEIQFEDTAGGSLEAAERMADVEPDLTILWGYGSGLAPGDDPQEIPSMEAVLGQPILLLHVASTLLVRNLLSPSVGARDYVEGEL